MISYLLPSFPLFFVCVKIVLIYTLGLFGWKLTVSMEELRHYEHLFE